VREPSGKGRRRGWTLAIGYDPDKSDFPPGKDQPPEDCAAKLEPYGRDLVVEDNGGCGGLNVSFTGTYVRVKSLKRLGGVWGLSARSVAALLIAGFSWVTAPRKRASH